MRNYEFLNSNRVIVTISIMYFDNITNIVINTVLEISAVTNLGIKLLSHPVSRNCKFCKSHIFNGCIHYAIIYKPINGFLFLIIVEIIISRWNRRCINKHFSTIHSACDIILNRSENIIRFYRNVLKCFPVLGIENLVFIFKPCPISRVRWSFAFYFASFVFLTNIHKTITTSITRFIPN